MNYEQQLNYMNKTYKLLGAEQEFIVHPTAFGLMPISRSSLQCSFSCSYRIEDYRLLLDKLTIYSKENGSSCQPSEKVYEFHNCTVSYNGALLAGAKLIKEYKIKDEQVECFSYQNVLELVFEDGILITTVDQSKKMLRIRKNLDMGLRKLTVKRDIRCIRHFMNSCFIGDYKPYRLSGSRIRYLKEMNQDYQNSNFITQINSIK